MMAYGGAAFATLFWPTVVVPVKRMHNWITEDWIEDRLLVSNSRLSFLLFSLFVFRLLLLTPCAFSAPAEHRFKVGYLNDAGGGISSIDDDRNDRGTAFK